MSTTLIHSLYSLHQDRDVFIRINKLTNIASHPNGPYFSPQDNQHLLKKQSGKNNLTLTKSLKIRSKSRVFSEYFARSIAIFCTPKSVAVDLWPKVNVQKRFQALHKANLRLLTTFCKDFGWVPKMLDVAYKSLKMVHSVASCVTKGKILQY